MILLNVVNGIIVDTFQTFREEDNVQLEQKMDYCYICSLKRGELEMYGINFENHSQNVHLVDKYLEFLCSLQKVKDKEMNYLDLYVKNLYNEELSSFIPFKETKHLSNFKSKKK